MLLRRLSLRNRSTVRVQKRWCYRWLGRGCGHRRAPCTPSILRRRGNSPYHRRSGVRPAELPGSSLSSHDLLPRLRLHGRLLRQTRRRTGLQRRRLLPRRELVTLLRVLRLLRLGLLLWRLLRLELGQSRRQSRGHPWRGPRRGPRQGPRQARWRTSWGGHRWPSETERRYL